ncbi:MAG: fimbria/pilus periplasmic chaperone [Gammaproteobacteria bacterium]|nr:fimbria/pilus periplasmic chaperone [Gammaproteobacteria bacterium]
MNVAMYLSTHARNSFSLKTVTQLVLVITCMVIAPQQALANANLMVMPTRVVFEERTRTAQVTLVNNGTEQGEFRISFINQNMTDNGQFEAVKADEKGMFANSMVRYSPRQITLAPGQSQVVRLMLRKPRDLEDGEYRSHLLFQSIPKASKSSVNTAVKSESENITVEIIPIVGISIPVIVRHGKLNAELKIGNAHIIPASEANPAPSISIDMHRTGNKSVYGDFRAIFTPTDGGEPVIIALVNGVSVYSTNVFRQFTMPISTPEGTALNNGNIRIIFLESGKDEKTGLIAETNFSL